MSRFKYFIGTCVIALLVNSPLTAQTTDDIIQPLHLFSGESDTIIISDLFYYDEYSSFKFGGSEQLGIEFLPSGNQLVITPAEDFEGIAFLYFAAAEDYDVPVVVKKRNYQSFSYKADESVKEVFLFGTFDDWNRSSNRMTDEDGDSVYDITIPLEPGIYEYKYYVDGEELLDPGNENTIPNGLGGTNNVLDISEKDKPEAYLHNYSYDEGVDRNIYSYFFTVDNQTVEIRSENVIALLDNKLLDNSSIKVDGAVLNIELDKTELAGRKLLRVMLETGDGISNRQSAVLFDGIPAGIGTPFTWNDAVMYSIMIDRFCNGDTSNDDPIEHPELAEIANYMGGDIRGIMNKMEEGYFSELGINTIWMLPVVDNPDEAYREYPEPHRYYSGYHGYWPISSTEIDEHFGDLELLKNMIEDAHENNVKILLDYVSNHVHEDHPWFGEHRDWFGQLELPDGTRNLRMFNKHRLTTWFEPYLPSFDYVNSTEAIEAVTDNAVWWLRETGADGFRHDAVKHVPNSFWRELTRKLKEKIVTGLGKDIYQIGETFGSYELVSSYVNNGQLDAQFDFNLYHTAFPVFLSGGSFADLKLKLEKTLATYGPLHLMGNIIDSHDKTRFMAYADGDLPKEGMDDKEAGWQDPPKVDDPSSYDIAKLYMGYMFTIPGIPVIYYGSEIGMSGAGDPDNRRMMRFGDELSDAEIEMLQETKKTVNLRNQHSALRYGDFLILPASENKLAWFRSDFNERLLILLNKGSETAQYEIEIPGMYETEKLRSLRSGRELNAAEGKVNIKVNGVDWDIYILE